MSSKNRKQVAMVVKPNNEKSVWFPVNSFNRQSSKFNDYPVTNEQFNDAIYAMVVLKEAEIARIKAIKTKRDKRDAFNESMLFYHEALKVYESLPEKTRIALKVSKPVKPGFKSIQTVSVKTEGNTKRNLDAIWVSLQTGNKEGLNASEKAYSSQLKSVLTAMKGDGKGDLTEALQGTLDLSLEEKIEALKAYEAKTGKTTFVRNNSPYVKVIHKLYNENPF